MNFIPHLIMEVIMLGLKLNHVSKCGPWSSELFPGKSCTRTAKRDHCFLHPIAKRQRFANVIYVNKSYIHKIAHYHVCPIIFICHHLVNMCGNHSTASAGTSLYPQKNPIKIAYVLHYDIKCICRHFLENSTRQRAKGPSTTHAMQISA